MEFSDLIILSFNFNIPICIPHRPEKLLLLQHAGSLFRLQSEIPVTFEPALEEALISSGAQYQLVDCQMSYNRVASMSGLIWALYDNEQDLKLILTQLLQSVNFQPSIPFDLCVDNLLQEMVSLKIAYRSPLKCQAARYHVAPGIKPQIKHWSLDNNVISKM